MDPAEGPRCTSPPGRMPLIVSRSEQSILSDMASLPNNEFEAEEARGTPERVSGGPPRREPRPQANAGE